MRLSRFLPPTAILGAAALCTLGLDAYLRPASDEADAVSFTLPFEGKRPPDMTLQDARTGRATSLVAGGTGRPVVLLFGSFTCDLLCGQAPELARLEREYGDRAGFVFVYIREAGHPNPALDAVLGAWKPDSRDARARARAGLELYGLDWPCLIDRAGGEAGAQFTAWPERLFVLDRSGVVAWDSRPGIGPAGLRLPGAEAALRACLGEAGD